MATIEPKRVVVGKVGDWKRGAMREAEVGEGNKVLVVRTSSGEVHAIGTKCSHYGAPLVNGVLSGSCVTCPWHAARFNVTCGDIEDGAPLMSVPSFKVLVLDAGGNPVDAGAVEDGHSIAVLVPEPFPAAKRDPCGQAAAPGGASGAPEVTAVVGAGAAGGSAVDTLLSNGYPGRIVLIGREPVTPYERIKYSKGLATRHADIQLRDHAFYVRRGVDVRLGAAVARVDLAAAPDASGRRSLVLGDGSTVAYDKLILATGGEARDFRANGPPLPGADLRGVFVLRTSGDAWQLGQAVARAKQARAAAAGGGGGAAGARVVVLGSSFIGMEVAAALVADAGVESVTVVGSTQEPLERVLGAEVGAMVRKWHEDKGVRLIGGATLLRLLPSEADALHVGAAVVSTGGAPLPADVVVIGAGVTPATGFVSGVPKAPDGGLLVDASLQVQGTPNVWAAGDIASFPAPVGGSGGEERWRIEHWDVAVDQGRVAGWNALGRGEAETRRYGNVPFFWTMQFGRSLRYCGHARRWDRTIVKGSLAEGKAVVYYVDESAGASHALAAVATVGADPVAAAAHAVMRVAWGFDPASGAAAALPSVAELEAGPLDLLVQRLRASQQA